MSNAAQEEVDRLFSQTIRSHSHPEDGDGSDRSSADEKDVGEPAFAEDPNQDSDDEFDMAARMAALTTSRSTFILPSAEQYANTGPKGVIADAQSFTRAKRDATSSKRSRPKAAMALPAGVVPDKEQGSSSEEEEEDEEDEEDEFMARWRANRIAEMTTSAKSDRTLQPSNAQQRRASPSRRTYGRAVCVDALGYLDAIEKVSPDTTVLVMIYDPGSLQSVEVEEEIDILAYKYGHVRFVKLSHETAEMEHVEIPALLAYRAGDVYATVSGAKSEGLEKILSQQGVFS